MHFTLAQLLQIWGAIGSSVLVVGMSLVKRRWKVADQRSVSHKTLREAARIYQDTYRAQSAYIDLLIEELNLAFESRKTSEEDYEYGMRRVKRMIGSKPDFLDAARKKRKEDIDQIVIPVVEESKDE